MTTSLLASTAVATLCATPCLADIASSESKTADSGSLLFYAFGAVALVAIYLMSRRIDTETDD